jgi:L-alanine-DL-glutamate epimerase-like enolase superfamily enzyme
MTQPISAERMALLQLIAKHPGVPKEKLLAIKGVTEVDLAYLVGLDLIREREAGQYRATHLGELALKRGL